MRPFERLNAIILIILSCVFLGLYGYVVARTLAYPFQLEWMEGGTVDVMQRIRRGLPVYQKPALDYVPLIYTPLYYHLSAALTPVLGVGFLAPRLLSCLSAIGIGVLIYRWSFREGVDRYLCLAGVGAFFATFPLSDYWFHLARNDSLALFLLLAGAYFIYHHDRWASGLLAATLLWLAFLAKQSTLPASLALLGAVCLLRPARGLAGLAVLLIATGLTTLVYTVATDGWFFFFVFELPARHETALRKLVDFWRADLFPWWTIAALMSGVFLLLTLREDWRTGVFYSAFSGVMLATAWSGRIHEGGHVNVLMPAHAVLSILMVLGAGKLALRARGKRAPGDEATGRGNGSRVLAARLGGVLVALQLLLLVDDPSDAVPTDDDRAAGQAFLGRIASYPGDVFLPSHRFVQTRVGKKSYGLGMAGYDLLRARGAGQVKAEFLSELVAALKRKDFSAILLQEQDLRYYPAVLDHYEWKEAVLPGRYLPVSGPPWRPDRLYLPRGGPSNR